jgi:hypothetical protein
MFRKLVENISFSPALIESLSRYAKELKREEYIRRVGLFALLLALVVQIATIFYPAEQANVASKQDFIYGGVSSLNNLIDQYDKNESHLKDIATSLGVTREDITNTKLGSYTPSQVKYTVGTYPTISSTQGERSFIYTTSNEYENIDKQATAYLSPATAPEKSVQRPAFVGTSINVGWFAIDKYNGSIILKDIPSTITSKLDCPAGQKSPENYTCQDIFSQTVHNVTQNGDASQVIANPNDRLTYTLTATNNTSETLHAPFKVSVIDLLEYAQIINISEGGIISQNQTNVQWSDVTLKPGESISHTLTVKVVHDIPATGQGYSSQNSYDCVISTVFSNTVRTPIHCPTPKLIEATAAELPPVTSAMVTVEALTLLLALFLYLRSRQLKEEVRLIRRDINSGSID